MKQDILEIKDWLKKNCLKYAWLAEQCFVSEGSVKNWFSKCNIPPVKLALIKKLMKEPNPVISDFANPPALPETELKNKLFITLDPETQTLLETQAHLNGMNLTVYCSLILERAVNHEYEFINDVVSMFEQKLRESEQGK